MNDDFDYKETELYQMGCRLKELGECLMDGDSTFKDIIKKTDACGLRLVVTIIKNGYDLAEDGYKVVGEAGPQLEGSHA